MRLPITTVAVVAFILGGAALGQDAGKINRIIPKPLPGHPGNIFLAGEQVVVTLRRDWTGPWRVVDYDGKTVAKGKTAGKISLGKLPVGYYEIPRGEGKPPIGVAVLAPLAAPTPMTSPIATDSSAPWTLGDKLPEVGSLCALAGVNWVRGRLNWAQMEPKRREFAASTYYDTAARELNKAGLKVLQVNHHTPPWAGPKKNRFPVDLRDAYRFYREMAKRWKGQVQAFEPWNEADWPQFGGHTGAEMASFQKACYWGLKAGNGDMIVCHNAFANYFDEVIADFHANQAWSYFDTLNFHHYWSLDKLPKYYAGFREVSGGRPMWVTECNFIRGLSAEGLTADAKTRDFDAKGLRMQAAHVIQIFATSIQGGAAAAGRLLADARPVGRLKSANKNFRGYLFRAKPDGKEQLVLVAWSMKGDEMLNLPVRPAAVFDTIGREQKLAGTMLKVTNAPAFSLFPVGLQNKFEYEPAPTMPPRAKGKPSPVVLQAVWPVEKSTWPWVVGLHSHYWIGSDGLERMPVYVYNFGDEDATGRLTITGPKGWKLDIPQKVTVKPMERVELAMMYDLSQAATRVRAAVKIEGDFGPAGKSLLSIRMLPLLPAKPRSARDTPALRDAKRWRASGPRESKITVSAVPEGILVELDRGQSKQKWFTLSLNLDPKERPVEAENALLLPVKVLEGKASLSVRFAEDKGGSFSVPYDMGKPLGAISLDAAVTPWTMSKPQRTLDPRKLRSVQISGDVKSEKLKFVITRVGWATF